MKLALIIALLLLATSACNISGKPTNNENATATAKPPSGNSGAGSAASDDKAAILRELVETEKRWKEAKFKGDTKTLEAIFADEFSNVANNGKTYDKKAWIAIWKRGDPSVKSWEINDERLDSAEGNKATITFIMTMKYKNSKVARSRDTDTFVKRDGRWQVISSQSSML